MMPESDVARRSVDVIIPMKNREASIQRAVMSALNCDPEVKVNVLVIDDGSTDKSVHIVNEIAMTDKRVSVHTNTGMPGAPVARNFGASLGSAEFIALLDSDDSFLPGKLNAQIGALDMDPQNIACFTLFEYAYPTGAVSQQPSQRAFDVGQLFYSNTLGGCSSALIRRSAFEAVGGFLEGMPSCQDWELWLRLATVGRLVRLEAPYVRYYFDEGERISGNAERVMAGHERLYEIINRMNPAVCGTSAFKYAKFQRLSDIFSSHIYAPWIALRYAVAATLYSKVQLKASILPRAIFRVLRQMSRLGGGRR